MVSEPVMRVVVAVDDRHLNALLNDLLARRGEVHTRTYNADRQVVVARVPLSELFGSEVQLRADSYERASCSSGSRATYLTTLREGPAPCWSERSRR